MLKLYFYMSFICVIAMIFFYLQCIIKVAIEYLKRWIDDGDYLNIISKKKVTLLCWPFTFFAYLYDSSLDGMCFLLTIILSIILRGAVCFVWPLVIVIYIGYKAMWFLREFMRFKKKVGMALSGNKDG